MLDRLLAMAETPEPRVRAGTHLFFRSSMATWRVRGLGNRTAWSSDSHGRAEYPAVSGRLLGGFGLRLEPSSMDIHGSKDRPLLQITGCGIAACREAPKTGDSRREKPPKPITLGFDRGCHSQTPSPAGRLDPSKDEATKEAA